MLKEETCNHQQWIISSKGIWKLNWMGWTGDLDEASITVKQKAQ